MQALVGFQSVPPVPVAAALDQRGCSVDGLLDQHLVSKEQLPMRVMARVMSIFAL